MIAATQRQPEQDSIHPTPTSARYLAESRELEIDFGSHFKGRWAIDSLQMIRRGENGWEPVLSPSDSELASVILWEGGDVVEFPDLDQHYSIPALLRGQLGSKKWMQKLLSAECASSCESAQED